MNLFAIFLASVVLITISGALAPGPLFFTNISNAPRWGWKGGLWLSIGHTFIEFPLILLIALGINLLIANPFIPILTAALGGIVLLVFGLLQIRDVLQSRINPESLEIFTSHASRHPLVAGLLLTALNPFFLIWWFTIGADLVLKAVVYAAFAGVFIMFIAHVWMDYAWLTCTAWLTQRGSHLLGSKGYFVLSLTFSMVLIYFGLNYCWSAFWMAFAL